MALPSKLKHVNIFNDSHNWLGLMKSINLSKLNRKIEAYRAGGMVGAVGVDFGLADDALQVDWSIGGIEPLLYSQLGAAKASAVKLRFMGSAQRDDTGEIDSVEVSMHGRHEYVDTGEIKQGEDSETKIKSWLTYYKLVVNGEVLVEIDVLNFIEIYSGVDSLEQHRKNIGL